MSATPLALFVVPLAHLAGTFPYAPADEPLVQPSAVSQRLYRDPRVSWVSHLALEPRSPDEKRARLRFAAFVLRGHHALEATWYACLVDRGPVGEISNDQWTRYWCTGLLGTVASLWLRDPKVQGYLGQGHREGVTLAQGLLPSVVVRLYEIGTTASSWLAQVSALREVARIAGSLDDYKPDVRKTIEERRTKARELLAKHLPESERVLLGIPAPETGLESTQEVEAGEGASEGGIFPPAPMPCRVPLSSSAGDAGAWEGRHDGAAWDDASGQGEGGQGDEARPIGPALQAQRSVVSTPSANQNVYPPPPAKPLNPNSQEKTPPETRSKTRSTRSAGSKASLDKSPEPSSPSLGSPSSQMGLSAPGVVTPPSGDRLFDTMRLRIARVREEAQRKKRERQGRP